MRTCLLVVEARASRAARHRTGAVCLVEADKDGCEGSLGDPMSENATASHISNQDPLLQNSYHQALHDVDISLRHANESLTETNSLEASNAA